MDPQRHERIHELLAAAVALPPAERAPFLDRSCLDDADLKNELESLLSAHERAGRFLADPAFMARPLPSSDLFAAGSAIGPYTLVRVIGEGGYGTVYLADQQHPIQRRVALKVIKAGMDTRQVISRFELERRALALMEHPNIARVLDAGATETGRPYFVMELVEGQPITDYCQANALDLHARLALFEVVCGAVQHAHQKGVIHRDIKPSNVLVMKLDGRPIPKIIDFGIAKALDASLPGWTNLTEQPQFLGTPQYMSPEQARLPADDLDTRCDVYALGVLLYELLTGVAPFDPERLRSAAYGEVQRIIREVDPPTPSARLSALGSATSSSGLASSGERRKLSQALRGELDWVVMKAMEKDRERRYGSAEALAGDLERYLRDEPVSAGRPSRWYRARKFCRRNRTVLVASALIVAALVAGLGVASAGLVHARRQRAVAEKQWELARASEAEARDEADRLLATRTFLYQLISPDFDADKSGVAPVAVLDYVARRIADGSLGTHADAEAPLRSALGNAYFKLEMYPQAERHYRANVELCRQLEHGDTVNLASGLHNLGSVLVIRGDYSDAEPLLRESLAMYRRMNHGDNPPDAPVLSDLGVALANTGRLDEAEPLLRAAIPLFRSIYPAQHRLVVGSYRILGQVLIAKGDQAGAEALRREAAAMQQASTRAATTR